MVKLSDAVQQLPRQSTQFVHGVPEAFLEVGAAKAAPPTSREGRRFGRGAYFIGKVCQKSSVCSAMSGGIGGLLRSTWSSD